MNIWLSVSLASALVVQAATPAPNDVRPRFAGTWRLDPARSESAAAGDIQEPVLVEIAPGDRDLTIVTRQGDRQHRIVHVLTDSPAAPYSIDGMAGRAYWQGAALVTEGTRVVQGQTVATRETRTLSADGSEMLVDVVVIVQHGYQTRGGRNYGIGRDVYRRVSP